MNGAETAGPAAAEADAAMLPRQVYAAMLARDEAEREARALCAALSQRELEVATLLCKGLTQLQICECFGLAPRTMHAHAAHIREKLGAETLVEAAVVLTRAGLV